MFFVRGILMWFVLMALMFINGAFRELVTSSFVGARTAEIAHVTTGCIIILFATCGFCRRERAVCASRLLVLGMIWALMTIAFETVLIVGVRGDPLQDVIGAYDITRGELWPIVVVTVLLAPLCAGRACGGRVDAPQPQATDAAPEEKS